MVGLVRPKELESFAAAWYTVFANVICRLCCVGRLRPDGSAHQTKGILLTKHNQHE